MTGERTPYLDPPARGVCFGIGNHHRWVHLVRAVFEGLALAQRDSLELLEDAASPRVDVRPVFAEGRLSSSKTGFPYPQDCRASPT